MSGLCVAIVSWNVARLLEGCLRTLYADLSLLPGEHQVTVVDNASTDGSCAMVRERFPQVELVENRNNVGFAAANNQALRRSPEGASVLLLNPDTEVRPGALQALVEYLDSHDSVGMVGPRLVNGDGSFQHSAFAFPTLAQVFLDLIPIHHRLTESRCNGRYPRALYEADRAFPIGHPLGACMLVRSQAVAAVGPMDEGFFMYCEEVDWAFRFHRAGWSVYCVPWAQVVHFGGQSTRQFRDEMFVALWRSRFRLFRKQYSRAFQLCAMWIVRVGLWRSAAVARGAAYAGQLSPRDLALRLEAFRRVEALTRSAVEAP